MTNFIEKTVTDENRQREYTKGKTKLVAVKTDPYGFWHVEQDGKKVDAIGVFTSVEDTEDGINAYMLKNQK